MKTFKTDYGIFTIFNADIENNSTLSKNRVHNQEMFENILKPYISKISILIDVGSGSGIRNIFFTKMNPAINIYCFEPRENLFCLLKKNVSINNIENTVIMNNMLGHIIGTTPIPIDKIICNHDEIIKIGNGMLIGENNPIHFVTLDSLKLIKCDFIFIDLSGCDYLVLLGGINTIQKFKPIICFKNNEESAVSILSSLGIASNSKITSNSNDLLSVMKYRFQNIDNNFILALPI